MQVCDEILGGQHHASVARLDDGQRNAVQHEVISNRCWQIAGKIKEYVDFSLMLVSALSPVIGYDKASKIAHYAMEHELTLKAAALKLGFVTEDEFDRVVDPAKMVRPYVAPAS